MMNDPLPAPLRVFIVENHDDTRVALQRFLEMLGHEVQSAATGHDALDAIPRSNCDVLISDIGLPDTDGWELMRSLHFSRPVYSIAMSGFGMNADRQRSKEAGFRHHILKPFDPEDMEKLLDEAAREKQAAALAAS